MVASWVAARMAQPSRPSDATIRQAGFSSGQSDSEDDVGEISEQEHGDADVQIQRTMNFATHRHQVECSLQQYFDPI